jgi:ABC-2 type transport system ATP-binding protein
MLEVKQITKKYNAEAVVDHISFTIARGEVLGYLGPNGSGKSTTVRMLTGLLEPTSGEVRYGGRGIRKDPIAYKRVLGYVPEEPFLYPYLSGKEYLQLAARLRCMPERQATEKIHALLALFSLYEHRFSPIGSYSKGMKQKVLICSALLHNPELIIFDEPLSGLDVTAALVFRNLITALARDGKMILYSSHVLEAVERVSTRVLILSRGQVVAHDSVQRLRALLAAPSLEDVFSQLAVQEDTEKIAGEMMAVIRG